ncbi:hypothetical protein C8Q78DRAFT_994910 [Trametes maxima]|nr:hypothetical protein C8Q78DRAFT_994910 [Trametes maxima]
MAASSASTTTLLYEPLSRPPTSNTLDARQRARLIRSTRKLGAVLGTTPQLLEQDSPIPIVLPIGPSGLRRSPIRQTSAYRKRRQGSVFEFPPPGLYDSDCSAASSASSLSLGRSSFESTTSVDSASSLPPAKSFTRHVREKSRSRGKQAPLPTPLVLRLNAVPLPPSDPRVQPITPDSSATLTFNSPAVPASSSSPHFNMIPTSPTSPVTPTVTETRRKRLAKLKRTLGENVPPELILPFRSAPSHSNSHSSARTRQPEASPMTPPPAPQTYSPPPLNSLPPKPSQAQTLPRPAPRRRSVSVDFQQTVSAPEGARRSSRVWVTGNGSWTGEWNRRDIREVQQQLRNLRAR